MARLRLHVPYPYAVVWHDGCAEHGQACIFDSRDLEGLWEEITMIRVDGKEWI